MAIKPTIYKARVAVADMDRGYYDDLSLTLAKHPSETDERLMVRLVAYLLHASDRLAFTEGLSSREEEPEIWRKDLTGGIELWIDVGLPDPRRIRKACNRSERVYIYSYGRRAVQTWWRPIAGELERHENLSVIALPQEATQSLAKWAERTMTLQCNIQEGQIWMNRGDESLGIEPELLFGGC